MRAHRMFADSMVPTGLYTDESPGLKVDPVVVMTLSVVFIFSVVALHGKQTHEHFRLAALSDMCP